MSDSIQFGVTKFDLEEFAEIKIFDAQEMKENFSGTWMLLAITHEERLRETQHEQFVPSPYNTASNGNPVMERQMLNGFVPMRVALFVVGRKRTEVLSEMEQRYEKARAEAGQLLREKEEADKKAKDAVAALEKEKNEHKITLDKYTSVEDVNKVLRGNVAEERAGREKAEQRLSELEVPMTPLVEPTHIPPLGG